MNELQDEIINKIDNLDEVKKLKELIQKLNNKFCKGTSKGTKNSITCIFGRRNDI